MGNSQSHRTGSETKLNTLGRSVAGGIGGIPGVGPMMVPFFEKMSSFLGIFRTKPNIDNNSVQENMFARQKAEAAIAEAARMTQKERDSVRAAADAAIAEAERRAESVIQVTHQALKAREEAENRAREIEKRERKAASKRERNELKAAVAEAQKLLEDTTKELEKARADALKSSTDLRSVQGVRRRIISKADEQRAKERIQYNNEKLHFAVCGPSGSGKSSLINAFRGLETGDKDAAKIGEVETTTLITRYPDLRTDEHYSRFVWYDIPGAGTMDVKGKDYFRNQGLFVFDFIVVVYGERFTEIALDIINECIWFKIPMFVVRSKSDSHIENKLKMEFGRMRANDPSYDERYQAKKSDYVKDTVHDFNLQLGKLLDSDEVDTNVRLVLSTLRVYNVSALNIKEIVKKAGATRGSGLVDERELIDECQLIEDMLTAAIRRRYPKNTVKTLLGKGLDTITGAVSYAFGYGSESGPSSSA